MARARKDPRHRARQAALQILYQWDVGRADVTSAANTFFTLQWPADEPLPAESPLWELTNTFITPHTAGETRRYEDNVLDTLEENLQRLWQGASKLRNQIV